MSIDNELSRVTGEPLNFKTLRDAERVFKLIDCVKRFRANKEVSHKVQIKLIGLVVNSELYVDFESITSKLGNSFIQFDTQAPLEYSEMIQIDKDCFYIVQPLIKNGEVDRQLLLSKLDYLKDFLESVENKLTNDMFMKHARPAIIEKERLKSETIKVKIATIEEALLLYKD
jgi:valyl-tRNA synthetase